MKKLLNTLYVSTPGAYLHLDGETVVISADDKEIGQIPLHNIGDIVCFSYKGTSPALTGACAERGIGLSFLTPHGRFLARVTGPVHGNVLLRESQILLAADKERAMEPAKSFIKAKIYNSRWSLERTKRDHKMRIDATAIQNAIEKQKKCLSWLIKHAILVNLWVLKGLRRRLIFRFLMKWF